MEKVKEIVSLSLAERAKVGIKVRQPLQKLQIPEKINKELIELIKEEVNVKEITFGKNFKLDTEITEELREEGIVREVTRQIQEMRKIAGFLPKDKISVRYSGTSALNEILKKNEKIISEKGKIKDFRLKEKEKQTFDSEKITKIDKENLWLAIKKI